MTRPLHLARLTGTQEDMGTQHGRLVADDARRLLGFYRTMPERQLAGDGRGLAGVASRAIVRRLADAWQLRLARSRPADLAARSRAFVAAAGGPAGADATFATMDAMQNCVSLAARAGLGPFARPLTARFAAAAQPACSTIVAWGRATEDGELLFARNFDFPGVGVWDAAPAFTVCAPDRGQRYGFFAARGVDAPVVTVVNEAGLVIAPHTRWHAGVTWDGAMIVDVIHEIARRAESLADAIAIVRERTPSSSWGIAVGSARERSACVIEAAGPLVDVVRPAAGAEHLVCTNRYRTATLQAREVAATEAWALHANRRERRLRALLAERDGRPLAPRDLAQLLGDRHDASAPELHRHLGAIPAQPTNVHAAVVKPGAREAWVGVDRAPCCEGTWAHVAWSWDGPAGGWELGALAGSGFDARELSDFVAPHDAATRHVHDAVRAYDDTHDVPAARAAIERAVSAAPDDPSLRLAALWLALEDGDRGAATAHADVALAHETEPYRRAQLLLWAARASTVPRLYLDELATLRGDGIPALIAASRKKFRGVPRANLMMHDAY